MPLGPRCLITHLLALYKHAGRPSQFHICACIHNDRDNRDRMAKRQERIDAFTRQGFPPADQPLELLCEDHVGTYVIPFLCRWSSGAWHSVDTSSPIEATSLYIRKRGEGELAVRQASADAILIRPAVMFGP